MKKEYNIFEEFNKKEKALVKELSTAKITKVEHKKDLFLTLESGKVIVVAYNCHGGVMIYEKEV